VANSLFDTGREGFLAGEIDWDTAVIKAVPVRSYTFSAAHKFLSDVTTAGGVLAVTLAASPALAGKSVTGGVADASDLSPAYAAMTAGAAVTSILLVQASAVTGGADVAATSVRLIAYLDTGTNIPFTPNGGDINIAWGNVAGTLIFKL
jgi:hypothetical protein